MDILIIPGFTGYPEEITFQELETKLLAKGHKVVKIAWPNYPERLNEYNFTNTINFASQIISELNNEGLAIIGFSMGGIIAAALAMRYQLEKLIFVVSPYQAGNGDDLSGKYKEWKDTGYREIISSKYGKLNIPFSFIKDAQRYNALEFVSQIKCPKLFIAGEQDSKVPLDVSRKLFNMAAEPKKWFQISGMEHKYQYQPDILKIVDQKIIEFIEHG